MIEIRSDLNPNDVVFNQVYKKRVERVIQQIAHQVEVGTMLQTANICLGVISSKLELQLYQSERELLADIVSEIETILGITKLPTIGG